MVAVGKLEIKLSSIEPKIKKYVDEYYGLLEKPVLDDLGKDMDWVCNMVRGHVEYAIIGLELAEVDRIDVSERIIAFNHEEAQKRCILKKGYDVEKRLGNYSDKFLLKGSGVAKAAKVTRISLWQYKQKDEMKSVINNEFKICKKAEKLGIGPRTYDTFICYNRVGNSCYKVIISDYIVGKSLDEWMREGGKSDVEKRVVYDMVKAKIDKMHENGIIHGSLYGGNIILKYGRGGRIVDVFITDFIHAYDVHDKKMWDYNKWIQQDRYMLGRILGNGVYSYNNADDVVNYVAGRLIANKDIVVA